LDTAPKLVSLDDQHARLASTLHLLNMLQCMLKQTPARTNLTPRSEASGGKQKRTKEKKSSLELLDDKLTAAKGASVPSAIGGSRVPPTAPPVLKMDSVVFGDFERTETGGVSCKLEYQGEKHVERQVVDIAVVEGVTGRSKAKNKKNKERPNTEDKQKLLKYWNCQRKKNYQQALTEHEEEMARLEEEQRRNYQAEQLAAQKQELKRLKDLIGVEYHFPNSSPLDSAQISQIQGLMDTAGRASMIPTCTRLTFATGRTQDQFPIVLTVDAAADTSSLREQGWMIDEKEGEQKLRPPASLLCPQSEAVSDSEPGPPVKSTSGDLKDSIVHLLQPEQWHCAKCKEALAFALAPPQQKLCQKHVKQGLTGTVRIFASTFSRFELDCVGSTLSAEDLEKLLEDCYEQMCGSNYKDVKDSMLTEDRFSQAADQAIDEMRKILEQPEGHTIQSELDHKFFMLQQYAKKLDSLDEEAATQLITNSPVAQIIGVSPLQKRSPLFTWLHGRGKLDWKTLSFQQLRRLCEKLTDGLHEKGHQSTKTTFDFTTDELAQCLETLDEQIGEHVRKRCDQRVCYLHVVS
jgi:hypothetical protein